MRTELWLDSEEETLDISITHPLAINTSTYNPHRTAQHIDQRLQFAHQRLNQLQNTIQSKPTPTSTPTQNPCLQHYQKTHESMVRMMKKLQEELKQKDSRIEELEERVEEMERKVVRQEGKYLMQESKYIEERNRLERKLEEVEEAMKRMEMENEEVIGKGKMMERELSKKEQKVKKVQREQQNLKRKQRDDVWKWLSYLKKSQLDNLQQQMASNLQDINMALQCQKPPSNPNKQNIPNNLPLQSHPKQTSQTQQDDLHRCLLLQALSLQSLI